MTAAKLVPAIKRIAERATKDDERAILALLALAERQHDFALEFDKYSKMMLSDIVANPGEVDTRYRKVLLACASTLAAGRDAGLTP